MSALDAPLRAAVDSGALACVAAMAATGAGVIHEAAFGVRDPATGAAMSIDSVARIASMTKALTSIAALRLVERGILSLDAPVSDMVPALAHPRVIDGFAADGTPGFRAARCSVTLRHLLTHTSGYGYPDWNAELMALSRLGFPRIPADADEMAAAPLLFDPGTRFNYGIGIDIAGHLIEAATGQSLDAHLRETLLAPLGMHDTSFAPDESQRARAVVIQARLPDGSLKPISSPFPNRMPYLAGGGGLHSTARDYLAFLREILAGAPNLLRPEHFSWLDSNQIGALTVAPFRTQAPRSSNDVVWEPGQTMRWSLAFQRNERQSAEGRSAGSLSWAGLVNCYYWIDRTRDVCGVFITGVLPFHDAAVLTAFRGWEAAIYRSLD